MQDLDKKLIAPNLKMQDLFTDYEIIYKYPVKTKFNEQNNFKTYFRADHGKVDIVNNFSVYLKASPKTENIVYPQTKDKKGNITNWIYGNNPTCFEFIEHKENYLVIVRYATDLPNFTSDFWLTKIDKNDYLAFINEINEKITKRLKTFTIYTDDEKIEKQFFCILDVKNYINNNLDKSKNWQIKQGA
jgi:hypothetical protein